MWRVWVAAVVLTGGVARADQPGWHPPGQPPTPQPPAALPPVGVPTVPDMPAWTPPRPDGPVWSPVSQPTTPQPDPVPPAKSQPAPSEPLPPPRRLPTPPEPKAAPAPPKAVVSPTVTLVGPAADHGPVLEPPPGGAIGPAGGVPVRHGTFGSPNLTLSRDYHFLDLFGLDLVGDADTVVAGDGPAEDRAFVQIEYLLWWVRRADVPALVTSGQGQSLGYLGTPGTQTLLGPGGFGATARNGFRIRAGTWLDDWLDGHGIDGSFFFLGRRTNVEEFSSSQFPTLARPFFAPNAGAEFAQLVSFPGLSTGSVRAETSSYLWGADLNFRTCICRTCSSRSEWFVGYRHLTLEEDLTVTEFITAQPGAPDPAGTRIVVQDRFATRNRFNGGQLGWAGGRRWGRFEVGGRVSVALGVTDQTLSITGFQQRVRPGAAPEQFTGGLLAAGPNIGRFTKDRFSVVPEGTLNVGYFLTPRLKTYVGYNFLYWSNVIRPGDQIDRVIDLTFVPNTGITPPPQFSGMNRPQPTFHQTDFWAQGLQFGLELRW